MTEIHRFQTTEELAEATAIYLFERAQESIEERGSFSIALAGGTTPKETYRYFADLLLTNEMDPTDIHIFWGDERCVPADDPMSNFRMAYNTLLSRFPIPDDQVHVIRCEDNPKQSAADYENELRDFFDGDEPKFDVVLLGLGANGHTASLFPGSELLEEKERWVAAEFVDEIGAWRATLTPPAINAAHSVVFLVQGKEKAEAVQQIIEGDHNPNEWPAQIVEPEAGELHWFLDEAAALMLRTAA